jgi:hypothetical protein
MVMTKTLVALDFDGVVCNGLREYFQTSWRVYLKLWNHDAHPPSEGLEQIFYKLRPVVESGWEMPLLIHALESGFREAEIVQNWTNIALDLLQNHALDPRSVGALVDETRDRWIVDDFGDWLSYQTFYPGMLEYLAQCDRFVIISTKEGRFIRALLNQGGITLKDDQLYGKERQQPKHEILRQLKPHYSHITFIEDRYKTLQTVAKHADLDGVDLLLADWGYNLESERDEARRSDRIKLVSIPEFTGTETKK